jgi:myosin-7
LDNTKGGEFEVPIGAIVKYSDTGQLQLVDDEGNEHWVDAKNSKKVRAMHQSSVEGVEDMIQLGDLHEAGILHNLLRRYQNKKIYTYTGSILVAINPYTELPIYDAEHIQRYRGKKIGEEEPHIFAIADNAWHRMLRNGHDQCVIISGESGAGKTESTKLILQFLAAVSGQHSWIERQVLDSNPILEAFGNAKTVRNDNSSRFGKFIDIHFSQRGVIEGALIDQYLLEKSRLVHQQKGERNYHIFYRLLVGLSKGELDKLSLTKPSDYHYLVQGETLTCEGLDERAEFAQIKGAMKVLNFEEDDQWNLWQIVAAILHLGNIAFGETEKGNLPVAYYSPPESAPSNAARLLGVDMKAMEKAMCTHTTLTHGEVIVSPVGAQQAKDVRDAFVKGVYGKMFVWIVDKIDTCIYQQSKESKSKKLSIGLLDIFGFERFEINSFEQMCINYCNENLQQFFVRYIFKLEQAEYDKENISWTHIEFKDNQDILDMIAVKPLNFIALIDEESRFPKGTDASMLQKLIKQHGKNPHFVMPKSSRVQEFGIVHFAGKVFYSTSGFLEKNRDTFSADLFDLLHKTKNPFLAALFKGDSAMSTETRKKAPTLGPQFKKSLDKLMKTLEACQPFFVRCVKPNELKAALVFDRELCTRQLRYSGMMETIRIRRAGYPIRHVFSDFVERYHLLVPGVTEAWRLPNPDHRQLSKRILSNILEGHDWQIGKTKVFLKDQDDQYLEEIRETELGKKVIMIQKTIRGWLQRKRYKKMKWASVIMQKNFRRHRIQKRYLKMKRGFARLQATFKARKLTREFRKLRRGVSRLQCFCRGYLVRQECRKKVSAAISIQAIVRMKLQREKFKKMLAHHRRMKELEAMRKKEEEELMKKMAAEEARKEAERKQQEYLEQLERQAREEEEANRQELEKKKEELRKIEEKRERDMEEAPDDSQVVDDIFGFLGDGQSTTGQPGYVYQGDESRLPLPAVEIEEDISVYKFSKFATTYFQGAATHSWIHRQLKQPLLPLKSDHDRQAAVAIWTIIRRFMGDLPEPKVTQQTEQKSKEGIGKRLYDSIGRALGRNKLNDLEQQMQEDVDEPEAVVGQSREDRKKETLRKRIASMTLKKKSKISQDVADMMRDESTDTGEYQMAILQRPTNNLEKLHFIIGYGILREELRDEIYSQICKQLTQNPSKSSHARGWVLLSLCVGCFAPSEKFIKYLRCFISEGPPGYAPYCEERLRRTQINGTRSQPPSWLELQATKSKKPLMLPITFMDGNTRTLLADSATTAKELCTQLAEKIGLKDAFGFSLYVALFDKVSSLGSGGDHVLDAISQCEQYAKELGAQERNAPWRLFFRKEIFAPWHKPSEDPVGTNLIYQQVVRGIKFGEYRCDKTDDLAALAAQQYYVEYGHDLNADRVTSLIPKYVPDVLLQGSGAVDKWTQLVINAYKKARYVRDRIDRTRVKEEIVMYAKLKWPLLFSRFYEAYKFSGPVLPKNDVIIAVNWTGVYIVDDQEHVLLECSFPELTNVSSSR